MSSLADQQHCSENVFEGASLITIRRRYEGYLDLARRWTLEREKHNQEEKLEDEECDVPSLWTTKQMIKHGIFDIYEDVQLFEEEIKNGKRVNEEKEVMEKAAAEEICQAAISTYKYWDTISIHKLLQLDCYVGKLPC